MRISLLSALIVVSGLAFAQRAWAEEVRLYFTATVTNSTDVTIAIGSPITGIIVYDSDATPVETAPPGDAPYQAIYQGISLSINIAGYTAEISGPDIVVTNDGPWGSEFSRDAFGCGGGPDNGMLNENFPESLEFVGLELQSNFSIGSSGPLASVDLPLSINLGEFQFINSFVVYGADDFEIDGVLESIVRDYDADSDGIRDGLDICLNTPAGKPMKANGCVEGDYDNDGDIDAGDLARFSEQFGLSPGF